MSTNNRHQSGAVSPINGEPLPMGKQFKAGEEQRERSRAAGIKSGEARRARKTLKEELLFMLGEEIIDGNGKNITLQKAVTSALIKQALNGNVKAYEVIRDTIGERQSDKLVVAEINNDAVNEVENIVLDE